MFGGSFNPIHFGHLLVADDIAETLALDRVLFVPAAVPPHKPVSELAPAVHRFAMTRLAVAEHPRFEVSDVELRRSGPSYTVDTLEALRPRGELHLIIGSETFLDLLSWHEPGGSPASRAWWWCREAVTPSIPTAPAAQKVLAELALGPFARPGEDGRAVLTEAASLPISGSDLRRRARTGRSLAYRMPAAVVAYIREHGLYRDAG